MPDTFQDRMPTSPGAPKPGRIATVSPTINETPSAKGAPVGGTEFTRGNRRDLSTADSRAQTSSPTHAPSGVATFDPDCT